MNWKQHIVLGIIVSLITWYFLTKDLLSYYKALPIVLIYSLLPDIDSESSIIFRVFLAVCFSFMVLLITLFYFYKNMLSIYIIVAIVLLVILIYFLSHRGLTHSLLLAILFSLPLLFLNFNVMIIGFVCYISHLVGDSELKLL